MEPEMPDQMPTDLCYLPATRALELFRLKALSPVELLQAQIDRAQAVEPVINAFSGCFFEEALDQARASEARYARGQAMGPLDGITLAAKEENLIKGFPNTMGSLAYKNRRAGQTAVLIKRCQEAGAIIHAQTTTPEFSCVGVCHSQLWGVTRNPWNTEFSPGGSSGGAGASLAAGTTALATGSDIAGSIRIPASACGLVGFKPPYGRIPQNYPFKYDSFCHPGPMARTVGDCILLENVMAGPSPRDMTSLKPKYVIPADLGAVKGLKIAYSPDLGYFNIAPDVRANTESVLDMLREAGAQVEEVDLGWTEDCLHAAMNYLGHFFGNSIAPLLEEEGGLLNGYTRAFAEFGRQTTAQDNIEALGLAGEMYLKLGLIHEAYDALICPTLAVPSVPADFDWTVSPHINDTLASYDPMMVSWCLTYPFNMLNRCPVLQMPSGRASCGVPTGVQIVGRTYEDSGVFRIGQAIEAAQSWYQSEVTRPRIPGTPPRFEKTGT
jgi:amidase